MKEMVYRSPMPKKLSHKYQIFRNILYTFASIFIFLGGIILYGLILNLREPNLIEAMNKKGYTELSNVSIVIDRKNYTLQLYSDENLIKSYRAVFGKNSSPNKISKDDHATPAGKYQICSIDTQSIYHKFLQLNFPNQRDAAEAYKNGYISKDEFDKILYSIRQNSIPCKNTGLGAEIGIHGIGEYDFIFRNLPFAFNWTNGSVAVSNESIDELLSVVRIGTKVEIQN